MASPRGNILFTTVAASVLTLAVLEPTNAWATTVGPLTELTAGMGGQRAPAISWDPVENQYVIVWEDSRNQASNGIDLYAARVSPTGTLVDTSGIALLEASVVPGDEIQPRITYSATALAHFVAWNEARFGLSDIFATRFFANSGSVVPTAGVQVSSGNDSEAFPAVAAGAQSVLVVFQSTLEGGGRAVQGRRLFPDTSFVDPAVFTLGGGAGGSAANPAVVGVGASYIVGWEEGADLFGTTIPDFGIINSPPVSTISMGPSGQTRIALSRLGVGNITAVWQDNRGADLDIWGRRYANNFVALGAEAALNTVTEGQLTPRIDGDDNGALLVWQDRRNGVSNALIYGARLAGTTGAVVDTQGFPILALGANAFEPTVARGPTGEYLVAAVQFNATTPRIFYRIVKDEVPSGTMTAMGPAQVPADGVSVADISFGTAQGASGLAVVDGTLYTVTLDQTGVEIVQPDVDPAIPGHQLGSADGQVLVSLRTIRHEVVTITVTSDEGNSSGIGSVEFTNVAPVASNAVVGPATPRSDEDLNLTYVYADVNLDPEGGSNITWLRDGAIQAAYTDQLSVPASVTRKDDQWRARVTPRDGLVSGVPVFSNTVIVLNTPPSALSVRIVPDADVRTATELEGRYIFDDQDGDAESGSEIRWYESDVLQADLNDQLIVPAARVVKGQSWYFTVLPSDGNEVGPLVTSATVDIVNTLPVADAGENGAVIERRAYTLDGTGSSDVDPQDVLQFEWVQVQQGAEPVVTLTDTSSPTPSFTAPSVRGTTVVTFDLTVSDDTGASPADRVVVEITALADGDGDGLDDEEETREGTDPAAADSDRDGVQDGDEFENGLNPLDEDSDDDGVRDGLEGASCVNCDDQDPLGDADGDTLINALDPDSDNDGLFDGTEIGIRRPREGGGTAPYEYTGTDVAAGNYAEDLDPATTTLPLNEDTDNDTLPDGTEDANQNGRVDDGESDPNDSLDPGISCTSGGNECPAGFTCGPDNLCVRGGAGDAGMTCDPLPDSLECCSGGCVQTAMEVDAICMASGSRAQCPVGSDQCQANTCRSVVVMPEEGGCSCTSNDAKPAGWLALGVLLLFGFRRRRR